VQTAWYRAFLYRYGAAATHSWHASAGRRRERRLARDLERRARDELDARVAAAERVADDFPAP
jgi:hypothetical protein